MHLKTTLLLLVLVGLTFLSCSKYVAIAPPSTQIPSGVLFNNDQAALSAANGVYSVMTQNDLAATNGGATIYAGLSADELVNTAPNADYDLFRTNTLIVNNGTGITLLWKFAYQTIYEANAVLEGITHSEKMSDSVKQQLRGEMLTVRALQFFYLVNFFGDVPETRTTDYRVNQSMARMATDTIYHHLTNDLLEARALLKTAYPSASKARPNRWTAAALLARIYLYRGQYAAAVAVASEITGSNQYSLATLAANPFGIASTETIWQLPRYNANTVEAFTIIPTSAAFRPAFAVTDRLLSAFETGDNRKAAWLAKSTVSGTDFFYPYKYKVRALTPVTENLVVFRLAEIYLVRAEAKARLNSLADGTADLNAIRNRAGLPSIYPTTILQLLEAIEQERRIEFFSEWGHRWLDLKRWGKTDTVLGPYKSPNWQTTDALYPIPLNDILSNPFLVQNPGYQ